MKTEKEAPDKSQSTRIVSMDQLRGYAIFGMFLVNARGLFFEPVHASMEGASAQGNFETEHQVHYM